jgi:hypothetical protein
MLAWLLFASVSVNFLSSVRLDELAEFCQSGLSVCTQLASVPFSSPSLSPFTNEYLRRHRCRQQGWPGDMAH